MDQEALMKMLQALMKDQGEIKIGNFVIQQQEPKRNNTTLISHNKVDIPQISKSQQDIDYITTKPNDFVNDLFFDEPLPDLDQFIEQEVVSNITIDSQTKPNNVQKQLFSKTYQMIDKFSPNLKEEFESALEYDFEQLLKPKTSECSSDTMTTITDTTSSDPLRTFLMSLIPMKSSLSPTKQTQIDFLFLYSQPLLQITNNSTKKVLQKLEINKELNSIKEVFIDVKAEIKFMATPARMDRFGEALDLNPKALHYAGHGIYMESNQQSYLLFEQLHGVAQLVSANQILLSLQKLKSPILFVFVASCHSKLIGEVFHQAGAEHVICVHTKEQIMDEACCVFARSFYHSLIKGQQTVCQAFLAAKNQVKVEGRFPYAEENKFLLLTKSHHQCSTWLLREGEFKDLTPHQNQNNLPSLVPNFTGRSQQMQEVIDKIIQNQLINIKGVLGIGKSALIKEISIYIAQRNIFKNGVVYIQLNQCDSFDSVASRFAQIFMPNLALQSNYEIKQLMVTQIIQTIKNQEFLLILDNCDLIMHSNDRDVFVDFLELILANCKCHLCITNRSEILQQGRVIKIEGLPQEESAQLFINSSSREITIQEVEELLGCNDLLNKCTLNDKHLISKFSNHALFQILDGHPQGIILSSGLLENYTLKELYQQLSYKQLMDLPISSRVTEEERRSLRVSLNLSWANLVERYEKAAIFFGMLGLLPCGIYNDELNDVWGPGWEKLATQLIKSSLLLQNKKNTKTHYCLYNFTVKFAESKLEQKWKRVYHHNIVKLLLKKSQTYYTQIGTQAHDLNNQPNEDFLAIEQNIKSAIFREFEIISNGQFEIEPLKQEKKDDENDDETFNLPLTKENLEMMQKKYENNSQKSHLSSKVGFTGSVISSFKYDQISDDHMTNGPKRKSFSIAKVGVTISEEDELQSNKDYSDNGMSINYVESKIFKINSNNVKPEPIDDSSNPQEYQNQQLFQQAQIPQAIQSDQTQVQKVIDPKFVKSSPNPNPLTQRVTFLDQQIKPITQDVKKQKYEEDEKQHQPLSKRQIIPKMGDRAKSGKAKEESTSSAQQPNKKDKIQKLILYYCQILLLQRRYNECLKFINWAYQYFYGDLLFTANIIKTKACIYYMLKEPKKSQQAFKQAKEMFIKKGCTLGVACCEAASGYISLQERSLLQAKVNFENALQFYEQLNHDFGKHFLNRWLLLVKNKISSLKNDRAKHIQQEKMLIENLKQEFKKGIKVDNLIQKKHKGGVFILRWLGDTLSIFMEIATVEDSKQKDIMSILRVVEQNPITNYKKNSKKVDDIEIKPTTGTNAKPTSSSSSTATLKRFNKIQRPPVNKQLNEIVENAQQEEDPTNTSLQYIQKQQQQQYSQPQKAFVKKNVQLQMMPCQKKTTKNQ
ncbi:unnamed protein product [Paramecium primaurelia]|uniref:CHAT domain-containing protein n=1 Tax=Paramecium primaurelia TaxID=5886 RepID=A0A8S1PS12_PARPR|nr:unnamed protein product [Paramecium primaurelia]